MILIKNESYKTEDLNNYNCFFSNIAYIAACNNKPFDLMTIKRWKFELDMSQEGLVNKIVEEQLFDLDYSIIKKYCGIQLETHNINFENKTFNFHYPSLVHFDAFWCPWSVNYQSVHYDHYFYVIDQNQQSENILCLDPYYQQEKAYITQQEFYKGLMHTVSITLVEQASIDSYDIKQIMKMVIDTFYDSKSDINLNYFVNEITQFNPGVELAPYHDLKAIPLCMKLNNIMQDRLNIANNFLFLHQLFHNGFLYKLYEHMVEINKQWNMLCLLFMKMYKDLNNNNLIMNAVNRAKNILKLENEAISLLKTKYAELNHERNRV